MVLLPPNQQPLRDCHLTKPHKWVVFSKLLHFKFSGRWGKQQLSLLEDDFVCEETKNLLKIPREISKLQSGLKHNYTFAGNKTSHVERTLI